jgi:transposase
MEIVHSRCAGMDVSMRDAKVCVRAAGRGRRKTVETVRTWGATTNAILALREHLINERVTLVVMEATGDYGKPFYYLLGDAGFEVLLVNLVR